AGGVVTSGVVAAFIRCAHDCGRRPDRLARPSRVGHPLSQMAHSEEFWIPLVDEPLGGLVDRVQRADPEIASLVGSPRRMLAFRTFAYIRVGVLLGQLLVEQDLETDDTATWVEQVMRNPAHRKRVEREVRAVAEEIANDPRYA